MHPLRPFQKDALNALENPGHLVCQSPTGSGKSRIFLEHCARQRARAILVTPLISLGRQQALQFAAAGIPTRVRLGGKRESPPPGWGVWILSPEALTLPSVFAELRNYRPNFLIIDECHCLWEWGDEFRPSYLQLFTLLERLRIERGVWLSATLPRAAAEQIHTRLRAMNYETVAQGDFKLPAHLQIRFLKVAYSERLATMARFIRQFAAKGMGIVFTQSRMRTEEWRRALGAFGIKAVAYHAGLSREERMAIEKQVMLGRPQLDVVLATTAFGLGMDIAHLQWAMIEGLPTSLLAMCQMLGRVGRSQRGIGMLIWSEEDFGFWQRSSEWESRRIQDLKLIKVFLDTAGCRYRALAPFFSEKMGSRPNCGQCDSCLD